MTEYSDKEKQMIAHFGLCELVGRIAPIALYRLMVEKAFLDNDQTKWAESLRRCMKELNNPTCYRMTPEFDSLIADA